jgi:carbon storage regulator
MLVLARKKAETILIGQEIVIKVLQMRNGVVRIGIDAPPTVRVMRGELRSGLESGLAPHPASSVHAPEAILSSISEEVTVLEEQCRPAAPLTTLPEHNQVAAVSTPVPAAAPLATLLRALRVVPPDTDGSAVQLRSPHRN